MTTATLPDYTRELDQQQRVAAYLAYIRAMLTKSWEHLPDTAAMRHIRGAIAISDHDALRNASTAFVAQIQRGTVLGAMSASVLHALPRTPVVDVADPVLGGWVAEGATIPLAKVVLTPFTTQLTRLATLIAFDARTLDARNRPLFEQVIVTALRQLEDRELLGAAAAVANLRPAGLLNGLTAVPGTTLSDKLAALFAAVPRPRAPYLVCSAGTAMLLTEATWTSGSGSLASTPLIISNEAAGSKLILIDAGRLVVVDDKLTVAASEVASLEMSDTPTGHAVTNAAPSPPVVSMFQTNSIALRCERFVWWQPTTTSAVAFAVLP